MVLLLSGVIPRDPEPELKFPVGDGGVYEWIARTDTVYLVKRTGPSTSTKGTYFGRFGYGTFSNDESGKWRLGRIKQSETQLTDFSFCADRQ